MDVAHDAGQAFLGVLEGPRVAHGVLLHLQARGGNTAGVRRLARGEQHPGFLEGMDALGGGGHVCALDHGLDAVADQGGCVFPVQLVLGSARQGDIHRHVPDRTGPAQFGTVAAGGVVGDSAAFHLLDLLQQSDIDARLVHDVTGGVGAGNDLPAELLNLLDGVDGHVPGTRDRDALAVEGVAAGLQHFLCECHDAVAGCLGANQRPTPVEALAGQHTGLVAVGDPLVLAEHVADLAAADADVTGGHVGVLTQVAVQLGHEGLAETHHLGIGPAVRVEIGTALAAADGQTGQGVLEDLLESQEFDDAQVDRGMEPQTTLVGAESRVELNAETAVDLHRSPVVHPGDTEDDLALGLADALQDLVLEVARVLLDNGLEALEDLPDGLVELGLAGVTGNHGLEDGLQLLIHSDS